MKQFYLGTHMTNWLAETDASLFVSQRTLSKRKGFPRAKGIWALDSGGFSELSMFGSWETTPKQYANSIKVYHREIGNLQWAAQQDWMCEPHILKKTRLTVPQHQKLTVLNFLKLRDMGLPVPIIPVLQGWAVQDYWKHVDLYEQYGVNLTSVGTVGIGSVCRRQHMQDIVVLVKQLHHYGISLHGFGVKLKGLSQMSSYLKSADSMAWSFEARYTHPFWQCTHKNCANCLQYALYWRDKVMNLIKMEDWGI